MGVFFIAYAFVTAIVFMPDARKAHSPILYIVVIGGIFVGIPAAIGIGIVSGYLRRRKGSSRQWVRSRSLAS